MASEQMSTTPAHAKREKGAAASSSSSPSSSEEIDEDDFFHIEGPILSTQYSLSVPPAAADEDGGGAARSAERPDPKRIPSSVFARSKSTTPTDWSVTSNESLFSINVGNASFSKDHLFLYGKTGELGNLNDPLPPLPKLSPSSSPMKGGEVAAAAEKASTSREKAGGRGLADRNGEDSADYVHSSSHRSDESTTSFAFPILTGSAKTSGSLKDSHPELARQSTAQLTHPAETRSENDNKETAVVVMEAPKVEQAPAPAVAAAAASPRPPQPPATTKWFPCCSCCPFCC